MLNHRVILLFALATSIWPGRVSAQEPLTGAQTPPPVVFAPAGKSQTGERIQQHRFWDNKNAWLFAGVGAARTFDYFSTLNFRYHGVDIHNHNSLLGQVRGVDGIKTGYTEASGYNLVTSVRREGRQIVAVVLGGRSNAARDTRMRELIEEHIGRAASGRTAPATMDVAREEGAPVPIARVPVPAPRPQATPGEAAENALASAKTELIEDSKPVAKSRARPGERSRHAAKQSSDAAQRARASTTFNGFNFFSVR